VEQNFGGQHNKVGNFFFMRTIKGRILFITRDIVLSKYASLLKRILLKEAGCGVLIAYKRTIILVKTNVWSRAEKKSTTFFKNKEKG